MYAKVNGSAVIVYPYTMETLQSENPHTKFNANNTVLENYVGTEDQLSNGYEVVSVTYADPEYCPPNKVLTENDMPHQDEEGNFVIGYTMVDKTGDALASAEAEVIAELDAKVANSKIEYAYTIAEDSPLSSDLQSQWVSYFAALDDLANLDGYPWSFDFPAIPPTEG